MFDQMNRFIIEDYTNSPTFASFLPGISGIMGIPIWCFYVNRGQGISSFGVRDKNHSIMEFHAAQQAYQNVSTVGFRTFLKVDGKYYEPFYNEYTKEEGVERVMYIGSNEMEVDEKNPMEGIQINALYYTLPNEDIGGLVRQVTLKNISKKTLQVEFLDGMPQVIPYGVDLSSMKMMGQTVKAWMQVQNVEEKVPFYSVRASLEDSAVVKEVKGGHFYFTMTEKGELLPAIVDSEVVFMQNTSLTRPLGFITKDRAAFLSEKQICQNALPCGFFSGRMTLKPGETYTFYSLIGQVENKMQLKKFQSKVTGSSYFENKYQEAKALTEEICKVIETKTASQVFDAYCKQTYLDNVLRGGMPLKLGEENIYHVYSRKHGDTERDYNFFSMSPEFYSQGNANFRDVNQNRRCDIYFAGFVKDYNIKTFYNLIQLDGYNPLNVQGVNYTLTEENQINILKVLGENELLKELLSKAFTPGSVLKALTDNNMTLQVSRELFISELMKVSEPHIQAVFGEGYWTDHWTYNLDLIESYLGIYPEAEKALLFEDHTYTYFESAATVRPRSERYVLTENGVRQYNAIDHHVKAGVTHQTAREKNGKGDTYTSNLFEKMMILATNKFATLDPYGMGIEMEGGKPGWYDALNGLPGIFGSSMAETYELYRMIEFMRKAIKAYPEKVTLPVEMTAFIKGIEEALVSYKGKKITELEYWNQVNQAKETYRTAILWGIEGEKQTLGATEIEAILSSWLEKLQEGTQKAIAYGEGLCPTYFSYEVKAYEKEGDVIIPRQFQVICMPYFLEGPVRYLKVEEGRKVAKALHEKVKASELYDAKLKMYKVNAPLKEASFEVGRAKAFTPGWLENESIWLHMEYKYLLELLRAGLYEAYFESLQHTLVPFLDPKVYGRSILENSSFIASSANPNEKIHGRGFVARLSGSTAEFLHMWQVMMLGEEPFKMEKGELILNFTPALPAYLIGEDKIVKCQFLGDIEVVYHLTQKKDVIPGKAQVIHITLTYKDGSKKVAKSKVIGRMAEDVRNHQVSSIHIELSV